MSYSSLPALLATLGEDVLVQITDRASPPAGVVDPVVVERAIAAADAMVDASLAVRYRLPLADVPAIVAEIATAIAAYKVHRFAPDQKIKDDYGQALSDLRDVASGVKKLDLAGLEPTSSGANGVVFTDRPRHFSTDNLRGFI